MYMISSTAEVMCGGSACSGLCGLSVSPDGCSSSWKAFSTERREKNVVMALKGVMTRSEIFLARVDSATNSGSVKASSLSSGSCTLSARLSK